MSKKPMYRIVRYYPTGISWDVWWQAQKSVRLFGVHIGWRRMDYWQSIERCEATIRHDVMPPPPAQIDSRAIYYAADGSMLAASQEPGHE